jgi:hypothetical protein|tara:strand:- start:521 stop:1492 length:972 start_codon:yes stop_codon:yes gene_type:complete
MLLGNSIFQTEVLFNTSTYSVPFVNSESWVKTAFTTFFNNCWGPRWYSDGRQIQSIEAIVQTQSPDTVVSDTNNTAGAYAWDIRFNTTGGSDPMSPNPCHQRFYYRPAEPWTNISDAADGSNGSCTNYMDMLMGYDDSGPESVGVSTGTFTNFDSGTVPEATWELQNTSKCIGGDCQAYRIYQKVGETLPYKLIYYDCTTGEGVNLDYFATRSEADSIGSQWITSENTKGSQNSTGCTDQGVLYPWTDTTNGTNGGGSGGGGSGYQPIPCGDSNAIVLSDGSCGACNSGYAKEGGKCVESKVIPWMLYGGLGLMGLVGLIILK